MAPSPMIGDLDEVDVNEATALLKANSNDGLRYTENGSSSVVAHTAENTGSQDEDGDDTPLPKKQIFLLCYARLVEPIAFFSIFPFINKMIWETGNLNEADVGFYAGMIESLFSLTQMLLMLSWGRAADRFGRKPILVISLVGCAIATAMFGFSKTIWQMILFRCFAGIFAGTVVTVRAMISENSTRKTQAQAFSYFAFTGNLGIFLGPLLGGVLAEPATQYPSLFGKVKFLRDFPYALPTLCTGTIALSTAVTSALFIKETLDRKAQKNTNQSPAMSTTEILKYPGVATVLFIGGYVMSLGLAFTAVIPVFMFTDVQLGGLGFSPLYISVTMAIAGASQAIWILFAFPPLHRRFGNGAILRVCAIVWPIMFACQPLCNMLLRHNMKTIFWIVFPPLMSLGSGVSMAFTGVTLATNDISPTPATLGTVNALALTIISGLRAIAPALFASLFATGARTQMAFGYLAWVVMIVLAAGLNIALKWLPEKVEGKPKGR
ncbi:MFS transporter [Xylogone sp. PMI_703]|nr:MFS transporter [Xylogone sp. PMI_703]